MKHLIAKLFGFAAIMSFGAVSRAQGIIKHAGPGFDVLRMNVLHRNIDSVSYPSATVGTKRRVLIYTPPGYSRKKNTPCYIFYMALAVMRKNG